MFQLFVYGAAVVEVNHYMCQPQLEFVKLSFYIAIMNRGCPNTVCVLRQILLTRYFMLFFDMVT